MQEIRRHGMLAASPKDFAQSRNIKTCLFDRHRPPISMTNRGLQLEPILIPNPYTAGKDSKRVFIVPLNCSYSHLKSQLVVTLVQSTLSPDVFSRLCLDAESTAEFRAHQRLSGGHESTGPSGSGRLDWMNGVASLGERRLIYVRQPGFPPDHF